MPPFQQGSTETKLPEEVKRKDYGYKYPNKLNLRPGSELHDSIKTKIMERALISASAMSNRHESWKQTDEILTTYVRPKKKKTTDRISARSRQHKLNARQSSRDIEIVFPYSYTILETLLSYMFSTYVQDPMFRYEGQGHEDIIGATLLEKVIAIDCIRNKVGLALHTLYRDGFVYGIGLATPTWKEKWGKRTVEKKRVLRESKFVTEDRLLYEGNSLENIDPYLVLPDPNYAIQDLQDMEYFGWVNPTNRMALLADEKEDDNLFNVKYLKHLNSSGSTLYKDDSGRNKKTSMSKDRDQAHGVSNPVDEINMYITLVPKEWKLGSSEYPEKWLFTIANDLIITRAMPIGLDHGDYPVIMCAPDYDGYSVTPVSKMEIIGGMQTTLDWMFNSHIKNVRKALNDMWVVDPYLINIKDVENPEAGKVIRTRRPAWGRGVKDAIAQFPVGNATQGHVADASFVMSYMDKIGGADSSTQGSLRQGGPERLTSAEFSGTQQGQLTRLGRIAQIIGLQSMQDIAYFFAAHTQQFLSRKTYVKIVGNLPEELMELRGLRQRDRVPVNPEDLDINYDVKMLDASMAGLGGVNEWIKLYEILATNPALAQKFDMVRVFEHIAMEMGAKDVKQFEVSQMGNEQISEEVQAGNLVPTGQAIEEGII